MAGTNSTERRTYRAEKAWGAEIILFSPFDRMTLGVALIGEAVLAAVLFIHSHAFRG
jgi:hypothetical protein